MSWQRVYGPDDSYQVCGDDALLEVGSVYGFGPVDDDGRCEWECEVVYYVTRDADGRYGTECMTHTYRNVDGDVTQDDYDHDIAGYFSFEELERAEDEARRFASRDESWMFEHWNPAA